MYGLRHVQSINPLPHLWLQQEQVPQIKFLICCCRTLGDLELILSVRSIVTQNVSMDVKLRKASANDLAAIVKICGVVVPLLNADNNYQWNDTYPLAADFEKDIANDLLWVADVNGEVAGFAALTTDQSDEYADVGWDLKEPAIVPHRVAVDPKFRGRSIALQFMLTAEKLAREAGYKYVRIDTNVRNIPMQKMFEKLNYEFAGEISFKNKPVIYEKMMFKCYQKVIS